MKKLIVVLGVLLAGIIYLSRYGWVPALEGRLPVPVPDVVRGLMASVRAPEDYWTDLIELEVPVGEGSHTLTAEVTHRYVGTYEVGFLLENEPSKGPQPVPAYQGTMTVEFRHEGSVVGVTTSEPGIRRRYYVGDAAHGPARDVLLTYHVPGDATPHVPLKLQIHLSPIDRVYRERAAPAKVFIRKHPDKP